MPVAVAVGGGLLAGLGLWIQPMIGAYLLPLVVTYILRLRVDRGARPCMDWLRSVRSLVAMGVGVVAGAAPLLVYNLREHWATLSYLYHAGLDGNHVAVGVRLITQTLPVLVGLAMPDATAPLLPSLRAATRCCMGPAWASESTSWLVLPCPPAACRDASPRCGVALAAITGVHPLVVQPRPYARRNRCAGLDQLQIAMACWRCSQVRVYWSF
jgi:hypothetical protein